MPEWQATGDIGPRTYTCGWCGKVVGPRMGYRNNDATGRIYECPYCSNPTIFAQGKQVPGPLLGADVGALPADVEALYREARQCASIGAYTSSVMDCRKLLMHIAVERGAPQNQNFVDYVNYLDANHYTPPDSHGWVDHIRNMGNEANHEIRLVQQTDAEELVAFVEMLLKFIYEYPSKYRP